MPNLDTDLFTTHVPKPVPNLFMSCVHCLYTTAMVWAHFVHQKDTAWYSWYTRAIAWSFLVHSLIIFHQLEHHLYTAYSHVMHSCIIIQNVLHNDKILKSKYKVAIAKQIKELFTVWSLRILDLRVSQQLSDDRYVRMLKRRGKSV